MDENRVRDERVEPDEPGEGLLTRTSPSGGIEPRILSDHDDPTLGEEMAETVDREGPRRDKGLLRGTPPPPPA